MSSTSHSNGGFKRDGGRPSDDMDLRFDLASRGAIGVASGEQWRNADALRDPVSRLQRLVGDEKLARIFKQIRAILGLSEPELARRLGTDVTVVLDFEAGAVEALPPWPVTVQLVERYAALANIDPSPILSRLISLQTPPLAVTPAPGRLGHWSDDNAVHGRVTYEGVKVASQAAVARPSSPRGALFEGRSNADDPQNLGRPLGEPFNPVDPLRTTAAPQPSADPADEVTHLGFAARSKLRTARTDAVRPQVLPASAGEDRDLTVAVRARRRRRLVRSLAAASPFAAALLLFALVHWSPRVVYAVTANLPGVLATPLRGVVDVMVLQMAPFRDGLRWIDPVDPRLRKGDRLTAG